MAPLFIKGFLPQQNGSAIMLPAEITTLSGSDFDVDKMYIMLPEFRIKKYNMRQAREDYAKENAIFSQVMSQFTNSQLAEDILNADTPEFKEWFKEHKSQYKLSKPAISKIKYDFNKSPQENSLEARNNLLIDMMYGVLTNADTASKILNPGGFDYQKKAARIISILNASHENDLAKALKDAGIKLDKIIQKGGKSYPKSVASYLFDLDPDTLDKLAEKTKVKMDPLSPRTQVMLHQQNMTGAKLIGIYANHNANHALMQHTNLAVDEEHNSFVLNGKSLTSLHNIMNADKEFISKNNAGFLAASVDNVKDPVLAALNQNTFTADATMLLSRLGYNPVEIGLLMAQPIVQEITQTYFRENRNGKDKTVIINEVLSKYREKAAINRDLTYDNYKSNKFLIEDLADNILIAKEATTDRNTTSDFRKIEFYQKQVAIGFLFERIMTSASALGQLVQANRADTQGGAAGPTIADTELKIQKVEDLWDSSFDDFDFPLMGTTGINVVLDIDESITDSKERMDTLRKYLLGSKLPFLQAFYTLGLRQSERMLKAYFPQFTTPFKNVVDSLRDMTRTGRLNARTMNSIYNDLLAYIMSKNSFFGSEIAINPDSKNDGSIITSEEKRKEFINSFPSYFKKVIMDNDDIADLEFIKRLRVIRASDNNPVETVIFKNVGQLSPTLRERYMRDWASLLYMSNPEAQKLALNLFRYSYYRNGFAFGPNTFIHLAPVAIRKSIPGYISTLRSLLTETDDYSQFVDQYVYNHLDNRKLVPEVPEDSSVQFIGNDNKIKDEVTFVIDENSNLDDKKVIRKQIVAPDSIIYDFFKYIGRKVENNWVYYRLSSLNTEQGNMAVYKRIEPLGYKNSFIEYEYGKDVEEMSSVIEKNDKDYDPYADSTASFDFGSEDSIDNDSIPESPKETLNSAPQINAKAFQQVYKAPLDNLAPKIDDKDITSIQPNTEYKDENNEEICGAPTIFSL